MTQQIISQKKENPILSCPICGVEFTKYSVRKNGAIRRDVRPRIYCKEHSKIKHPGRQNPIICCLHPWYDISFTRYPIENRQGRDYIRWTRPRTYCIKHVPKLVKYPDRENPIVRCSQADCQVTFPLYPTEQGHVVWSRPRKYCSDGHGPRLKGKDNPNYKTGSEVKNNGYVYILVEGYHPRKHKGKVAEHVILMEKHLGRFLTSGEVVHHKNGIRTDNRLENLQLCANDGEHFRIHAEERYLRNNRTCTICNSRRVMKHGFRDERHLFFCLDCNHSFLEYYTDSEARRSLIMLLACSNRKSARLKSMSGQFSTRLMSQ